MLIAMEGGVVPLLVFAMNSPRSPGVIPPMSFAVPLFWTKNVLLTKLLIAPAPTKPSGFEVPPLTASAASRPVKLELPSSC